MKGKRYTTEDKIRILRTVFPRRILRGQTPEPGGGSSWTAEGGGARKSLTRRPVTYNGIWIRAWCRWRDCAPDVSASINNDRPKR